MPAGPADIGITESSETLMQSIEFEKALSEVVRKDRTGGFAVAHAFDPLITGSLTILGTSNVAVGVAAAGLSSVASGITVFTEKDHVQVNDNFDETTLSFENAPSAETGAAS